MRADTAGRVLDAAEEVFAEVGYAGAGVREITARAGVRLAAVSDHFGGKQALYEQVVRRRAEPLAADRRARLAALADRGSRAHRLRALILAVTEPVLRRAADGEGWGRHARVLRSGQAGGAPRVALAADEAVTDAFVDRLALLYPHADPADLRLAHALVAAAVLDVVAGPAADADDLRRRHRRLVGFLQGGTDRLCRRSRSS